MILKKNTLLLFCETKSAVWASDTESSENIRMLN